VKGKKAWHDLVQSLRNIKQNVTLDTWIQVLSGWFSTPGWPRLVIHWQFVL